MIGSGDGVVPCSIEQAVQRMLELEASGRGQYAWGSGDYLPENSALVGMTMNKGGLVGWDCAGAAVCHAFRLKRHRPGFNRQMHASIEDDINVDSIIEDADPARGGRGELGELVKVPTPGILLMTPTIKIPERGYDDPGHVRMIIDASKWDPARPRFVDLVYLECRGPNGRAPGVVRNTGESVDVHNAKWPTNFERADGSTVRPRAVMVRIRAE